MTEIESERLLLRQWRSDDFEAYADYYASEETARFIGGVCDRELAWRRLASEIGHWTLRGFGFWAVEEKASGELAGCVGLWHPEGWPEIELGYWLLPSTQGNGFATEAALRVRLYAYEVLGLETLVSYIHPDNEPSKRVAERIGAHHEDTIDLATHGPHCVYRHPPKSADART